jgi:hypothetical protein
MYVYICKKCHINIESGNVLNHISSKGDCDSFDVFTHEGAFWITLNFTFMRNISFMNTYFDVCLCCYVSYYKNIKIVKLIFLHTEKWHTHWVITNCVQYEAVRINQLSPKQDVNFAELKSCWKLKFLNKRASVTNKIVLEM